MKSLRSFINQFVEIMLSGRKLPIRGRLIDIGTDILVLHNGSQFIYLPFIHIQEIVLSRQDVNQMITSSDTDGSAWDASQELSYRKVLMNAKGMFSELYITGNQSIHGYVTSIMTDYFVFHSPAFHTVLVSIKHLKYLIPYDSKMTPYTLQPNNFPLNPKPFTLSRTWDQQLKKLGGLFVVFDLGGDSNRIGLLKTVDSPIVEVITANGSSVFAHMEHLKTVHLPLIS